MMTQTELQAMDKRQIIKQLVLLDCTDVERRDSFVTWVTLPTGQRGAFVLAEMRELVQELQCGWHTPLHEDIYEQIPYDPTFDYPVAGANLQAPIIAMAPATLAPANCQAATIIPKQYELLAYDGAQEPTIFDYADMFADWIEDKIGFMSHPIIVTSLYFTVISLAVATITNR